INQRRASATKPKARLWFTTPVKETAAVAITAAAIAKPRMTRSDRSFSACVASVSARYRKYTAARSQISAIAPSVYATWTLSEEMSSEGATRSHPRGGLYVFVPCSQFPKGDGGRDGDERVQRHERDRVLEPPCVDTGGGTPFPVRVERSLKGLRQIRIFDDQT